MSTRLRGVCYAVLAFVVSACLVMNALPAEAIAEELDGATQQSVLTEEPTEAADVPQTTSEDDGMGVGDESVLTVGDSSAVYDGSEATVSTDEPPAEDAGATYTEQSADEPAPATEPAAGSDAGTAEGARAADGEPAEPGGAPATVAAEAESESEGEGEGAQQAEEAPVAQVRAWVQGSGWSGWADGEGGAGAAGRGRRVEALRVRLRGAPQGASVRYRAYVQGRGWQDWRADGKAAGAAGKSLRVEAVQVELAGGAQSSYDVWYRVYAQGYGWMGWARNGEAAGTAGRDRRVEAVQVVVRAAGAGAPAADGQQTASPFSGTEEVRLRANVQGRGWQAWRAGGKTAGTTGRSLRLEALRAQLSGTRVPGGVKVRAYVQGKGWQGWRAGGKAAGAAGRGLRVEAVRMRLTGEAARAYDLYYRAYVQGFGWLAWASSGKDAGAAGLGLRVEAVQARLVRKGGRAPANSAAKYPAPSIRRLSVGYATFVNGSWQDTVKNGKTSGAVGESTSIAGLRISLVKGSSKLTGSVRYRVYLNKTGWQEWVKNGSEAGAPGSKKRIEALQVKISGKAAKVYDVWYRVHSSAYGWMGWTKNGGKAGSIGMDQRVDAVKIRLVLKSASAPGSTNRPFVDGELRASLNSAKGSRSVTTFGGYKITSGAKKALQNAVTGIRNRGYDVGFIMMDLTSHKGVAYNCDSLFYGASSIKAPYIASVVSKYPDSVVHYAYDMTETLFYSWDYNYKQVLAAYGKGPMRTWCSESGARSSIAESLPWANYSARDLAKMWARNYRLFSESSAGEKFGKWCERPNISTIHATLGGKYRTRSKAGWIDAGGPVVSGVNGGGQLWRVSDDGGIVYAKNGAYVIAIMSSVPADHDMLNGLTAAIDRAHSEM